MRIDTRDEKFQLVNENCIMMSFLIPDAICKHVCFSLAVHEISLVINYFLIREYLKNGNHIKYESDFDEGLLRLQTYLI